MGDVDFGRGAEISSDPGSYNNRNGARVVINKYARTKWTLSVTTIFRLELSAARTVPGGIHLLAIGLTNGEEG